jgi:hypothetical protein
MYAKSFNFFLKIEEGFNECHEQPGFRQLKKNSIIILDDPTKIPKPSGSGYLSFWSCHSPVSGIIARLFKTRQPMTSAAFSMPFCRPPLYAVFLGLIVHMVLLKGRINNVLPSTSVNDCKYPFQACAPEIHEHLR